MAIIIGAAKQKLSFLDFRALDNMGCKAFSVKGYCIHTEDSELMTINHLAGIKSVSVHPELFELIELGKYHSLAEGSHLNITIGPLVQTWRIGFSDARLPSTEEIQQALGLTDPNLLELNPEDCSVFLTKKGMKLDLGALAKGYIADKIKDYLMSQGVTSALINLGGNVLTIGQNAVSQRAWRIGIQNPKQPRGNHSAILAVTNQSVVTSGIYERTLTVEGRIYDNRLLLKPVQPALDFFENPVYESPYPGAKSMLRIEEVEDAAFLCNLIEAAYPALPVPKKKK